jgi:hypothetical protein
MLPKEIKSCFNIPDTRRSTDHGSHRGATRNTRGWPGMRGHTRRREDNPTHTSAEHSAVEWADNIRPGHAAAVAAGTASAAATDNGHTHG